jgi:hypothetical protein
MNAINIEYDKIDAVPEAFRSLYTERDGKAVLTGVSGLKTQRDVDAVSEALRKERYDHALAREALKPWSTLGLKPEDIVAKLDKFPELEALAAAAGNIDEKVKAVIEPRIAQATAPLQRELATTKTEVENWRTRATTAETNLTSYRRNDGVRAAATELAVINTAIADIELVASVYFDQTDDGKFVTKSGIDGVTPGLGFKEWLRDMQKSRPHWWPASQGGGGNGGNGNGPGGTNPWSKDSWNMTEQGKIVTTQGMTVAEQMAKAAGTRVGGLRPTK